MQKIGLSVIIPMHNTAQYIEECITSIKSQTFKDFELILVDDCSTDNTVEIASKTIDFFTHSKIICNDRNKGAGACRNIGMDNASGKYLMFLDSDDFFEQTMFEKMYTMMESSGADVAKCGFCLFDDKSGEKKQFDDNELFRLVGEENVFRITDIRESAFQLLHEIAWDKMFRTDFVRKNNIRFQEQHNANDQLFVFQSLLFAESIIATRIVGTNWRRNVNNQLSKGGSIFPKCIYEATKATYLSTKAFGLYDNLKRSFNEYTINRLIQSIKMAREEDRKNLYDFYIVTGLGELGMNNLSISDFSSPFFYGKYKFFVGNKSIDEIIRMPNLGKFMWNDAELSNMMPFLKTESNLVLYGFGINGGRLYEKVKENSISWRMICDEDKAYSYIDDVIIGRTGDIKENDIVVTTNPYHIRYLRYINRKLKRKIKCLDCRAIMNWGMNPLDCLVNMP